MGNRWGNSVRLLFWGAPKSLQMVTAAMKLKDTYTPWKESYDQPRQHIQKQRHYFAKKVMSIWLRLWFFQWSCMDVKFGLWRKLSAEELMLLNCGVGEDSWESLGLQGDPAEPRDTCPLICLILASWAARHLPAYLPDTRQLSRATPALSSAW